MLCSDAASYTLVSDVDMFRRQKMFVFKMLRTFDCKVQQGKMH